MDQTDTKDEYRYTRAQWDQLTDEQRTAVWEVLDYLQGVEPEQEMDDEFLSETLNILRPCEGCIPEEEIGDDVLQDIRRKFACIYWAALTLATRPHLADEGLPTKWELSLVIDPSFDDHTKVAILDDRQERPYRYLLERDKAWNFRFENLAAIADEVLRARDQVLANIHG
jgi:hypothetical protein